MTRLGQPWSLRARLTAGAVALSAVTILTALTLFWGMERVGDRMQAALNAEARMTRYGTLSSQVSTFLVIATEAVQRGLPREERMQRLEPVAENIGATFLLIRSDLERAVEEAEASGIDRQSRHATQSITLARMEAQLGSTLNGLGRDDQDVPVLRAHIDAFASTFDPLLNEALNGEAMFRRETLKGIETLRQRMIWAAAAMVVLSLLMVAGFTLGLVRPQFRRLEQLRGAARRIGAEDFDVALPETRGDEIGALFSETNRMAAALAARQAHVQAEWGRLEEEIAQRTAEIRAANAQLEAVDARRRRFFADVSHELRTPLTVILMEAQIGRQTLADGAEIFGTIESRAARLNRRIDDLLRVARSDSGELALDPGQVDFPETVRAVVEEVEAECRSAGMTLDTQAGEGTVLADPNWLRQVLAGLVRNAIRHARDGGRVRIVAQGGVAAVIDNGPGIPAEAQARIFERFGQGRKDSAGFGLGLALAKWVIEAQGGEISVTSPVPDAERLGDGPGTKVSVRLPVAEG
ncbi:HAMP domain-containing sensor histidine kinase [Sagittula sp. MA-2]|uniref:sensor histidine kinase n=1 Tax=Sagittula sp. MA-2 TaxID=3048007 RepID=UPI0024C28391|nr:HAMP domain-containing sensor histidine kinase [Sagittula sp. MA-2]WHZ38017.1 HAMP domain-containing sensor histidine kinase [Sagittula sp. MA-2]